VIIIYTLQFDNNEKQSSRPAFLDDAWVYYKKIIDKPVGANIPFDLLLSGNDKKSGAEIKEIVDLFGSLPPKRLGRQCMDLAVECDTAYLGIMGSMEDVRAAIPNVYQNEEGKLVEKTEEQLMKSEDLLLAILGDIKELGVVPLFLSRDPIFAYRVLLKYMTHDLTDDPPMSLLCKPYKNIHAINMLANLPGLGWERSEQLIYQFGSVAEFMMVAQECLQSDDFTRLEEIKINNRRLGKAARKIFEAEGIWALV